MNLIVCGDTVPTDASRDAFVRGDLDALFDDVLPLFRAAQRVIVNLECALTGSEQPIPKFGPNLKAPPQVARTLKAAGVTDCSLANNHMFDFGIAGMLDTVHALEGEGIAWFGAGATEEASRAPRVLRFGEKTLAVLAVSEHEYNYALSDWPGAAPFDPFDTLLDIRAAKQMYDHVLVIYHGGKEHCRYPSPRLRKACRAMAELGADAVLCQHSHIVGCMEKYKGSHILYGQGNFHFVKYVDNASWQVGMIARFDLTDGLSMELLPTVSTERGVRLAADEEKEQILREFAERNEELKDGRWLDGWRAFCEGVGPMYDRVVYAAADDADNPRAKEHFAHYLDCEAHTDVWRERFPTWHRRKIETI